MRYLPITETDRRVMLEAIGVPSVEALFADVPAGALLAEPVNLPPHASEFEVEPQKKGPAPAPFSAVRAPIVITSPQPWTI